MYVKPGIIIILIFVIFMSASLVFAGVYYRPGGNFGQTRYYEIKEDDSLVEIARAFDLGYNEITAANPHLDPFIPTTGAYAVIPSNGIFPDLPVLEGIIVNIPEMRLYYFPEQNPREVYTFPIGIGDIGMQTPLGNFTIIDKIINPSWYVPKSIRSEKPELPKVMPPGPDNPMGSHALRLSRRSILIHGTNRPFSIGREASHGCIRLYPEDIVQLFKLVNGGTRVSIINQPVKIAEWKGKVYIQVHGNENGDYLEQAKNILRYKGLLEKADETLLKKATSEKMGLPVDITKRATLNGV